MNPNEQSGAEQEGLTLLRQLIDLIEEQKQAWYDKTQETHSHMHNHAQSIRVLIGEYMLAGMGWRIGDVAQVKRRRVEKGRILAEGRIKKATAWGPKRLLVTIHSELKDPPGNITYEVIEEYLLLHTLEGTSYTPKPLPPIWTLAQGLAQDWPLKLDAWAEAYENLFSEQMVQSLPLLERAGDALGLRILRDGWGVNVGEVIYIVHHGDGKAPKAVFAHGTVVGVKAESATIITVTIDTGSPVHQQYLIDTTHDIGGLDIMAQGQMDTTGMEVVRVE